jgi:hypothetical protein
MNPMDPLAELRDIVTPPPPSAWPWAPGWWILLILGLLLLSTSIWWFWRWRQRSRPRRLALKQLAQLQQQEAEGPGKILGDGPYRPPSEPLNSHLFVLCQEWIQLQNTASQFHKTKKLALPN